MTNIVSEFCNQHGNKISNAHPETKRKLKDCLKKERLERQRISRMMICFESKAGVDVVARLLIKKTWAHVTSYSSNFNGIHVIMLDKMIQVRVKALEKKLGSSVKVLPNIQSDLEEYRKYKKIVAGKNPTDFMRECFCLILDKLAGHGDCSNNYGLSYEQLVSVIGTGILNYLKSLQVMNESSLSSWIDRLFDQGIEEFGKEFFVMHKKKKRKIDVVIGHRFTIFIIELKLSQFKVTALTQIRVQNYIEAFQKHLEVSAQQAMRKYKQIVAMGIIVKKYTKSEPYVSIDGLTPEKITFEITEDERERLIKNREVIMPYNTMIGGNNSRQSIMNNGNLKDSIISIAKGLKEPHSENLEQNKKLISKIKRISPKYADLIQSALMGRTTYADLLAINI